MTTSPNPELLAEYGTDEVYLANLEKVADDTVFGRGTASRSRSDWGSLQVARGAAQANLAKQRAQAHAINQQLLRLENMRMAGTTENFGGRGTSRSRFIRAMQAQPYMVHPLMMLGGGGMASPESLGSMGNPMGTGTYAGMPNDDIPIGMMDVTASVKVAEATGRDLARTMAKNAQPLTPYDTGAQLGQGVDSIRDGLGNVAVGAGMGLGQAAVGAGRAIGSIGGKMKGGLEAAGRGFRDLMSEEVQATPRWGTGFSPPTDVNMYGSVIY